MPRYFFNVEDGSNYPDLHGTVLPDLAAARSEALKFAASLLGELNDRFWGMGEWHMRVADENDLTLFELTFAATDAPVLRKPA